MGNINKRKVEFVGWEGCRLSAHQITVSDACQPMARGADLSVNLVTAAHAESRTAEAPHKALQQGRMQCAA